MAARRTRIKGIANIPQRRKTTNPADGDEAPQLSVKADDKHEPNLTLDHVISVEKVEAAPLSDLPLIETPTPEAPQQANEDVTVTVAEISVQQKPNLPARRKFIKPLVSLNVRHRNVKDTDVKPQNNKIIILDEVISYPDNNHGTIRNGNVVEEQEIVSQAKEDVFKPEQNDLEIIPIIREQTKEVEKLVLDSPQIVTPEREYLIPPPSPTKVNRSRIKAVPRLSQRHTSFSASESEDESRRHNRHRNDSVCSTTSGLQDTNSITECLSPQKPREFNSLIQRKCRRTDQSRKLAEARRDFLIKFGNKKPDRQKLTMLDLIFYNPTTNLMSDNKCKKDDMNEENKEEETRGEEENVDEPEPEKQASDEENEIPAPQIKIGPEGEIVVDEQSLVIENKSVKKNRDELEKQKAVDGDFETGYGVYKRAKRSKDWSKFETLKFYKALNTIGTDFTLMCELFPRRSRRELKMKFKKEERINKTLVDRAIMQPCGFDFNDFKHEVDLEEKELMDMEKQKEREQQIKKEAKKRKSEDVKNEVVDPPKKKKKKAFNIMNVLDDDESDADQSESESLGDNQDENHLLESIQRPTRSGRIPKILNRYQAQESEQKMEKSKPGSLIVVAETGTNGEPVYKVCMVTAENNRKQIGEDMASLSKALECQGNARIQSLFTLTATRLDKPDEPMEECNTTIPFEETPNI